MISYPLISINLIIFFYYIFQKLIVFNWVWRNREKYNNLENKLYQKFGVFLPFRIFITYTNFGNTLCFLNSLYFLLYQQSIYPFMLSSIWSILFCVTIGYWIMVYPFLDNTLPVNMKIEISGHGPLLLLQSLLISTYTQPVFEIKYILYSIYLNLCWLLLIWLPWYLVTDDYIYFVFKKEFSILFKLNVILKICIIGILGFLIGHLIEFKAKNM